MVISKQGKTISEKNITAIVERKKPERATSLIQVMLLLVFSINLESGHLIDLVTAMNIVLHPFLAGLEGYCEAMNRLDFHRRDLRGHQRPLRAPFPCQPGAAGRVRPAADLSSKTMAGKPRDGHRFRARQHLLGNATRSRQRSTMAAGLGADVARAGVARGHWIVVANAAAPAKKMM